ncbi:MAG: EAL domain-containing protein [Acidimicrobiia bacterium]|nr:EAL domain-containing protein [Acidimicrobiia bacterium]
MSEPRLLSSPAVVLFSGVLMAVLWAGGLNFVWELSSAQIVHVLTTGAMGAVGASIGSLLLAVAARTAQNRFDEAEHRAKHDPLTGLLNRSELFRQLDDSLAEATANDLVLGVLFLDLDRFKAINDSLGHEVGDELLMIVADRLRSTVRSTDVVARLGGDEFVILCRGLLHGDSVVATARQILKRFREPISLNGKEHIVSTSIGVAIAKAGDNREPDALVSDADAAMYRAKETKTGYAVFDEAQRQQVRDRLDIEQALSKAIDRKEIVVHYQPIVDTLNRQLYGFEALVRWEHPERGIILPSEFLPIAAEAGMMARLGELVLREACAQAAVWNHLSPSAARVRMGVNLAEQQLVDTNLAMQVAEVLDWSGIDPSQLVLEITEDVIVDHLDGLTVLRDLRDLGVALAIDDFGTGQSSLSYVKQFDMVSTIKIDKAFVDEMHSANVDRAIVEAVVAMASALDLSIVAEGVEHFEQVEELQRLGVHLVQGYLFSPPLPADNVDPAQWFVTAVPQPRPLGEAELPRTRPVSVPADLKHSTQLG